MGFLLKRVQHVHRTGEPHRVHGAIRIAVMILYYLEDSSTSEAGKRLGVLVLGPDLGQV